MRSALMLLEMATFFVRFRIELLSADKAIRFNSARYELCGMWRPEPIFLVSRSDKYRVHLSDQ